MAGQSIIVRAPYGGRDVVSAAPYVRPDRGLVLDNMVPGRTGKVVLRGPLYAKSAWTTEPSFPGLWTWQDTVLAIQPSATDFKTYDVFTQTLSASAALPASLNGANLVVFMKPNVSLGAYTYGVTKKSGGTSSAPIVRWDGTAVTGGLVPITNGPHKGRACALHLNRLFVLGGDAPGVAPTLLGQDGVLYWTDPGWDGTDTLVKWQDDVSGLTNQIVVSDGTVGGSYEWNGLASYNGALYIFGQHSIVALRGSAPSNFSVRQVSASGCIDPDSIQVTDAGIYFLSSQGLALFDGVSINPVADPIASLLDPAPNAQQLAPTKTAVSMGKDFLTYCDSRAWHLYHVPTGSWSSLSSSLFTAGRPKWLGITQTRKFAADAAGIAAMDVVPYPDATSTTNPATAYGKDNNTTAVQGSVASKLVPLSSPLKKAQLRRVLADIALQSPSVGTKPTCTVTLLDEAGTTLATVSASSLTTTVRQRLVVDAFNEAEAVTVHWAIDSQAQIVQLAEIHDAVVEYMPAQDRTG